MVRRDGAQRPFFLGPELSTDQFKVMPVWATCRMIEEPFGEIVLVSCFDVVVFRSKGDGLSVNDDEPMGGDLVA